MNHICPNNLTPLAIHEKTTTNKRDMREVISHSTHIYLLNTIKSIITQTLEKLCNTWSWNKVSWSIKHVLDLSKYK